MEKSNLCNGCDIDDCPVKDTDPEFDSLIDLIDKIIDTLSPVVENKEEPDYADFNRMCDEIMEYYGFTSQLKKLREEVQELSGALVDFYNPDISSEKAIFNLIDEMADVEILLHQIVMYIGVKEFNDRIEFKLKRQIKRIEEDKAQRKI